VLGLGLGFGCGGLLRGHLGGVGGVGDRARLGGLGGLGGSDGLCVGARGEIDRAEVRVAQYRVAVDLRRKARVRKAWVR